MFLYDSSHYSIFIWTRLFNYRHRTFRYKGVDDMKVKLSQKRIAKVGGIFFEHYFSAHFFLKTFVNMTLPSVRVGKAKQMNLSKTLECEGTAKFQKEVPVYTPFEGKVLKVYVKAGDDVK